MRFELLHPADRLVMMMRRIYYRGMTTTSGGNLSIRDEDGDIWITPGGIDKGTLTRDDIMRVRADGSIAGRHKPSSEYPFHLAVYAARPLVCRTQGLALLYPANTLPVNAIRFRHPRGEVAACPLNYTEAEGTTSKEPAPGEVLDAGRLDEALATVNRAWCDASGTDPLARTDLREIR